MYRMRVDTTMEVVVEGWTGVSGGKELRTRADRVRDENHEN